MRRALIAAFLPFLALPVFSAETPLRIEGIAYTEAPVKEIQIQVWALGEQVAEHPDWQFKAVFDGVISPGKAFSVELGEARLPVLVELSADGHGAIALEVLLPEQLGIPPAWLRQGRSVSISVSALRDAEDEAVVWGDVDTDYVSMEPRRWRPAIEHRNVAPGSSFETVIPPSSSGCTVRGLHPIGHFGEERFRVSGERTSGRLDLATIEIPARVWDQRGRPVAGVRVVEASSPFETASSTDAEGRVKVRIPVDDQWKIMALHDDWMSIASGRGRPDGELEVDLAPRVDVVMTWEGSVGPLVIDCGWLPRSLGGQSATRVGRRADLAKLEERGMCTFWSPAVALGSARFDAAVESVVLKTRSPVSVTGRVVTADGRPAPRVPVWIRLEGRAYSPYRGMVGTRGGNQPLRRPWLPWTVSGVDGGFSVTGIPPSELQAEVLAPGLPTARSERLIGEEGAVLETVIVLKPGATLTVRTTDPNGVPLEGVTADVYRSDTKKAGGARVISIRRTGDRGDPELTGLTDVEGKVVLTQVPVGTVMLRLSRPGSVARTLDGIDVPAEGADVGDVILEPGVTLRGTTVGPDGEPVGNAEVAVDLDPRNDRFVAKTTSDEAGIFSVPDLAATGTLYLKARAEGFVPEPPLAVKMPPETEVEVTMAIERKLVGVVLDASDDAPVIGARVELASLKPIDPSATMFRAPRRAGSATTDSEGSFVIDGLAGRSNLELSATAPGLQRGRLEVVIPADADPEPVVLRLEAGLELRGRVLTEDGEPAPSLPVMAAPASQNIDDLLSYRGSRTTTESDGSFHFDDLSDGQVAVFARSEDGRQAREIAEPGQSEEVVLQFEPGLAIEGVVLDPDGAPVEGAHVGAWGDCVQNYAIYETSADGRFELENAKVGGCRVFARAEGYAQVDREIEVKEGGLRGLEMRLGRGATVIGQIRGISSSEIEGCRIFSDDGASTEPGMDGSFRLSGVRSGQREITARLWVSDRMRSVKATVPDSGETEPVIIDFAAGLTLSGRVLRNEDGVPGLIVTAQGVGTEFTGRGVSGPDGFWRIEGLDPGEYQVAAQTQSGEVVAGDHLLLETDTEIDLRIHGGRITGRVAEAETDHPIPGAQVTVSGSGLPPVNRRAITDASGFFAAADLGDGEYVVLAEADGWSPSQQQVTVRDGVAGELTLSLEQKRSTTLVVRSTSGTSPSTISVTTSWGGVPGPFLQISCSAGGRCEINDLPPGRWTLAVRGRSDGLALLVADLPREEIAVSLRPTGKLRLTPSPDDTKAVWQVRVIEAGTGIVYPLGQWHDPSRSGWMPVNTAGQTLILAEGGWQIETFAPDGTQGYQQATVTADGTTEVRLE